MRLEGSNPCRKIERYRENHRKRFLSGESLRALGRRSAGPKAPAFAQTAHGIGWGYSDGRGDVRFVPIAVIGFRKAVEALSELAAAR